MAFTPDTTIHFCSVPFDARNQHVIRFASKAAQEAYFLGKVVFTKDNLTYQRRDSLIRVPATMDELDTVNYVMYQNKNFEDRWFYAFINKLEYASPEVTLAYIETDVYQTWAFDVSVLKSFVVREHVTTDTFGAYTTPENLAYNDPLTQYEADAGLATLCILVTMNVENATPWAKIVGTLQDGIYSSYAHYYYNADTAGALALSTMLNALDTAGKSTAVIAINMAPRAMIPGAPLANGTRLAANVALSINKTVSIPIWDGASGRNSFRDAFASDIFYPKNKKCFTYPYSYMMITNNMGSEVNYRYEWMTTSASTLFLIKGDINPNASLICAPENYRGISSDPNYAETVTLAGYPLCAWSSDVYKNWLAQNMVGMGLGVVGAGIGLGIGVVTANPVAIVGGALGVAQIIGGALEKQVLPPASKGASSSAVARAVHGIMNFVFYHVHINLEDMRRIDNYFEQFGYKVADLNVPNTSGRPYWNYVQLVDANITGDIPSNDMIKLKKFYEAGITFWHDPTKFMDYSQNNH